MTRRIAITAMAALAGLALLWVLASVDRCGPGLAPESPVTPQLERASRGYGRLRAGWAVRRLAPPLPVPMAGYGPLRPSARGDGGVAVRALVLEAGAQRFGLVAYDTLLVPRPLVEEVRAGRPYPIWVAATHTHSSLGGFDERLAAQFAGVGGFRAALLELLVREGRAALDEAEARLEAVSLEVQHHLAPGLARARSGPSVDERLTWLRFSAVGGTARAQWLILSAHPTLVPREQRRLDADYPGVLSRAFEEQTQGPVTIVVQGAGGNATATVPPSELPAAEAFAQAVLSTTPHTSGAPGSEPGLESGRGPDSPGASDASPAPAPVVGANVELAVATASLPRLHPDASRLVPRIAQGLVENVLCRGAAPTLEVSAVRIGSIVLLALPFEPTHGAGVALEAAAGATRALGNVDGYEGYLEVAELAQAGAGEARLQYFDPGLLELVAAAARLAGGAVSEDPVEAGPPNTAGTPAGAGAGALDSPGRDGGG